jgi:hypothetical protein
VLSALLPGSDRKRRARFYSYRLTYRNSDTEAVGCVLLWQVTGGRQHYQVALERAADGALQLHCSCADAVFRCEAEGRLCKHARGLLEMGSLRAGATANPTRLGA